GARGVRRGLPDRHAGRAPGRRRRGGSEARRHAGLGARRRRRSDRRRAAAARRARSGRGRARDRGRAGGRLGMASRRVYGVGPVRELLRARPKAIAALYVDPGRADKHDDPVAQIVRDAKQANVAIEPRRRTELDAMAEPDARHQGVIAIAGELVYADLDDIVKAAADRGEPALVVALDGVQDPHNLGAVIRSAYLL